MDTSTIPQVAGIYCIRQLSTGRKYIGSAIRLRNRYRDHKYALLNSYHTNSRLQNAYDASGWNDFSFEVLEVVTDELLLHPREQWYLDNVIDWGTDFNIRRDTSALTPDIRRSMGKSQLGKKASDETRRKKSLALKGVIRNISDEERKRRSDAAREMNRRRKESGWTLSEDARAKKSEINKRMGLRPPVNNRKGFKHSEETKRKLQEDNQQRKDQGWEKPPASEETRRKISEASRRRKEQGQKPKPQTEEHRKKNSEGNKRAWVIRKARMNEQRDAGQVGDVEAKDGDVCASI